MAEPTNEQLVRLLQDVAESEHNLRHRATFAALCARLGLDLQHDGVRFVVSDPNAPALVVAPAADETAIEQAPAEKPSTKKK